MQQSKIFVFLEKIKHISEDYFPFIGIVILNLLNWATYAFALIVFVAALIGLLLFLYQPKEEPNIKLSNFQRNKFITRIFEAMSSYNHCSYDINLFRKRLNINVMHKLSVLLNLLFYHFK